MSMSQTLKDNPPLALELQSYNTAHEANPYSYQVHLYDKSQPENLEFLKKFRAVLDEFPAAAAVGEVGDEQRGLQIMADYTSGGDKVHMCYSFDFLGPTIPTPAYVHKVFDDLDEASPDGWPCWAFSNHDVERYASRWPVVPDLQDAANRMRIALLLCMRGSVCLYQGEELGLEEAEVAFEDLQDPYGIRFWPDFKGRDGCRTPMVWDLSNGYAGFSDEKPWLPVAETHRAKAVSLQEESEHSLLQHYRRLLAFRKQHPALVKGEMLFVNSEDGIIAFMREWGEDRVFCAFNLTGTPCDIPFDTINVQPLGRARFHCLRARGETGTARLWRLFRINHMTKTSSGLFHAGDKRDGRTGWQA